MSTLELLLLELVAADGASLQGPLRTWPRLRAVFRRLGAPHGGALAGAVLRQLARECLAELGARPRPDGDPPLVSMSLATHARTMRQACGLRRKPRRRHA